MTSSLPLGLQVSILGWRVCLGEKPLSSPVLSHVLERPRFALFARCVSMLPQAEDELASKNERIEEVRWDVISSVLF